MPAAEGPLLILVTAAGCLVGYEIIRRSALLRPLFGLELRVIPTKPLGQPERSAGNPGKRHRRDVGHPVQHLVPQDGQ